MNDKNPSPILSFILILLVVIVPVGALTMITRAVNNPVAGTVIFLVGVMGLFYSFTKFR